MISDPLALTNDPWIKSQGSHCKKGNDVGVHPFHRTKMAEKSSLFLPSPSHKCLPKREPLLQGKEIMGSNLHSVDSSPVFYAASISWSRSEKGEELAFSSRAWWKAGHGLSAGSGQPSFFTASADPGIGTLLMNTEPMWTHLFCICKMCECIWGRQHDGSESAWLARAGNAMWYVLGLRENEAGGVAFTGFLNRGNWSKISTSFILPSCYLN